MIEFDGEVYFDDRMHLITLCKGVVDFPNDGTISTTIYHQAEPKNHLWCVATYRNCERYPLTRLGHFVFEKDAIAYMKYIEPETPLISNEGRPPSNLGSYEQYQWWKEINKMRDYDWKTVFLQDGNDAREIVIQTRDEFKGIQTSYPLSE